MIRSTQDSHTMGGRVEGSQGSCSNFLPDRELRPGLVQLSALTANRPCLGPPKAGNNYQPTLAKEKSVFVS